LNKVINKAKNATDQPNNSTQNATVEAVKKATVDVIETN